MTCFCQDRDLLSVEPAIYLGGGGVTQLRAAGSDGAVATTTFTSATADFISADIEPGMVLCTTDTTVAEGQLWEILDVTSATTLSISVLRSEADDAPLPALDGSDLSYQVHTCKAQIAGVSRALAERLRQLVEANPIVSADFADSSQLNRTCVLGTLATLFVAQASDTKPNDVRWIKAEHYQSEFRRAQNELRLAVDDNGDGHAERTRSLSHVQLRRS